MPINRNYLEEILEMNSADEIFTQVQKKKVFRFNSDSRLTPDIIEKIFSKNVNDFQLFFNKSKLFIVFIEMITKDDIGDELKRTIISQREENFNSSLKQSLINNYLNFIKQGTDIIVNENLIESTLLNLQSST